MSTKSIKCGVCEEDSAKYRCPCCDVQTCSLKCCKGHKEDTGCTGQRNKTSYVPMKGFNDMHLLSDYRLLEDVDHSLWRYRGNKIVNRKRRSNLEIRLMKESHKRGIRLRLLPDGYRKRKVNSSLYVFSQKCIRWHIELQFPKLRQEASLIKVHERSPVGKELKTYLNSPTTSHLLWKDYRDNFDDLTLLVQIETKKAGRLLYRRIDPSKSVKDNLVGHVVLEFPTIFVVTRDELHQYRIDGEQRSESSDESDDSESEDEEPASKRLKQTKAEPDSNSSDDDSSVPESSSAGAMETAQGEVDSEVSNNREQDSLMAANRNSDEKTVNSVENLPTVGKEMENSISADGLTTVTNIERENCAEGSVMDMNGHSDEKAEILVENPPNADKDVENISLSADGLTPLTNIEIQNSLKVSIMDTNGHSDKKAENSVEDSPNVDKEVENIKSGDEPRAVTNVVQNCATDLAVAKNSREDENIEDCVENSPTVGEEVWDISGT